MDNPSSRTQYTYSGTVGFEDQPNNHKRLRKGIALSFALVGFFVIGWVVGLYNGLGIAFLFAVLYFDFIYRRLK